MHGLGAQKLDDDRQPVGRVFDGLRTGRGWRRRQALVVARECGGDIGHAQDQVHAAGLNGAARHAAIAGFVRVLCDDQAALVPDRAQARAAVSAGA